MKAIPLYARPFNGAPVTLAEAEEKFDADVNGRVSVMEVTLPKFVSTPTSTSQSEKEGEQKVAEAITVGTYLQPEDC